MAGFDSTAYGTLGKSGPDFYNSMKWSLDLLSLTYHNRTISMEFDQMAKDPFKVNNSNPMSFMR
jgi:hypothetical protein